MTAAVWLVSRILGETTAHDDEDAAKREAVAFGAGCVAWLCMGVETSEGVA